ncbi:hypothetical protein HYZ97_04390 [Candidatus Pacearchaeota archaeon]|nr:hypothetical protein [Candidatus Pacearchaeota archaeon]
MITIKELILALIEQPVLISLIAGIFGEDYVLLLMVLAGTGTIAFWKIIVFGFIGVMLHDIVVYFMGRTEMFSRFFSKQKEKKRHKKKNAWVLSLGHGGYIVPMIISKFIYGTRVFATLYASQRERKFSKFFLINSGAVLLWFAVMAPVGWFAGKGFTKLLAVVNTIEKVLVILLALIVIYFVIHFIYKKFMNKPS